MILFLDVLFPLPLMTRFSVAVLEFIWSKWHCFQYHFHICVIVTTMKELCSLIIYWRYVLQHLTDVFLSSYSSILGFTLFALVNHLFCHISMVSFFGEGYIIYDIYLHHHPLGTYIGDIGYYSAYFYFFAYPLVFSIWNHLVFNGYFTVDYLISCCLVLP